MTGRKQEEILKRASLFYGVFPADTMTVNHRVILRVSELVKRIWEYKGNTRALPKKLLEAKYNEIWEELESLESTIVRGSTASKEALKAIEESEALLNCVFMV